MPKDIILLSTFQAIALILSNHTRVSMIQSNRPENIAKNYSKFARKFQWNSRSTALPYFLSNNSRSSGFSESDFVLDSLSSFPPDSDKKRLY